MLNRKGQSTIEYAVVGAVVIAALLAMQVYMRRGAMGSLQKSADQIGEQFDPVTHTGTLTKTYNATRTDTANANGSTATNITTENQTTTGSESIEGATGNGTLF